MNTKILFVQNHYKILYIYTYTIMVNTIIKSKKLKSIIDDIKKKNLKENIYKLEGEKDKLKKAKETYISVIANKLKEQEELEERIKALEEKNESQGIALLKEI